jgi:hypothetical protein
VTNQVKVSWIGETRGLVAVDSLSEGAIEEGILHIELLNQQLWETVAVCTMRTVASFTTGLKASSLSTLEC